MQALFPENAESDVRRILPAKTVPMGKTLKKIMNICLFYTKFIIFCKLNVYKQIQLFLLTFIVQVFCHAILPVQLFQPKLFCFVLLLLNEATFCTYPNIIKTPKHVLLHTLKFCESPIFVDVF